MYEILTSKLLYKWYPICIDSEKGGYFTNLTYDFKIMDEQPKMLVTQARHIWTASKSAKFLSKREFIKYAEHGYKFLKTCMWDNQSGGLYQMRSMDCGLSDCEGFFDEKRTYGNAFAVYGLAALFAETANKEVLDFAQKIYYWIEEYAYDPEFGGYFQFLTADNEIFNINSKYKTKASDAVEVGYKDQNSSIHLLEAYTELYHVWKDPGLKKQLSALLRLIRDTIAHPDGYLRLFFDKKWNPVSFREESRDIIQKNFRLDHVSFGHDYETAFLMLEASHALGIDNDVLTLNKAKKMLDHAIDNGWDNSSAGFFDEGYYFDESDKCEIVKKTKTWWAQIEGLNALLIFSKIFPDEKKYSGLFFEMWEYIITYLIDHEQGDFYWGSLEKEPAQKTEPKGSIWKCTYHTARSLMNCILVLSDKDFELYKSNPAFKQIKNSFDNFLEKWKFTAQKL
ncbi:MAG: AGE family epimerase/isomerase [Melioribacteraceae bacterium]|nr:AGE family epimerase/isomerase [Melioribacteraceae bacterium]